MDYAAVSRKLVGARNWIATRYYVGQMPNTPPYLSSYAAQRKFLAALITQDPKISVHLGRMERRPVQSPAADELKAYVGGLKTLIDPAVRAALFAIAKRHATTEALTEKAVDVMLSVDLVDMAAKDEFDAAYILSADGDFTPAVKAARDKGKKVFAASCANGAQLAASVDKFIPLHGSWFSGCYS